MKILGFDTAAKTASVALTDGGRLVSEFYLDSGFTHSETVLPMAKALLDNVRIKPEDIDVFAVNCGPGSFTGLRIGIAAVKAMAMSLISLARLFPLWKHLQQIFLDAVELFALLWTPAATRCIQLFLRATEKRFLVFVTTEPFPPTLFLRI